MAKLQQQPAEKPKLTSVKERTNNAKLIKATEYRKWGGIVPYLMKHIDGMREFVYEELYKTKVPAEVFLQDLGRKFPKLPKEMCPSESAVKDFKKKLAREGDKSITPARSQALALRDEVKIFEVLKDFNLFEERLGIYKKSDFVIAKIEQSLEGIIKLMEKTGLPPAPLWSGIDSYLKALDAKAKHLFELDKLAVRFGYLPAMLNENKNYFFQQNTVEGDVNNANVQYNEGDKETFNIRVQQLLALTKGKERNDAMFGSYPKASVVVKEEESK